MGGLTSASPRTPDISSWSFRRARMYRQVLVLDESKSCKSPQLAQTLQLQLQARSKTWVAHASQQAP